MRARDEFHGAEDYDSAAGLFRALSHPLRVRLVCGLLHEPLTQTAISKVLGFSQSLIAQHLAVLRRAGIVRGTRVRGEVALEVSDPRLPRILTAVCAGAPRFFEAGWEEMAGEVAVRTKKIDAKKAVARSRAKKGGGARSR